MIDRRALLAGIVTLPIAATSLAACTTHGAWRDAPSTWPYSEHIYQEGYRAAAVVAGERLRRARATLGAPSLTAAVARDGRLIWTGAVGYADIEAQLPASETTIYRLGSTSKAVTSTVLARLIDEGRLHLDQPIGDLVSEPLPNPAWASLTPRRLSSHTAGLPGYEQNSDLWGLYQTIAKQRRFANTRASLEVFDDTPLIYEPGERYLYSSFDVNLLSYAMEGAGAAPYLELVQSRVTSPLGLRTPIADGSRSSDAAISYGQGRDGQLRRWRSVDLSDKWASGGLAATSADLARIGVAWLDPRFIQAATRIAFWTEQPLNNGQPNGDNYAIGWRVNRSTLLLGPERPLLSANHAGVSQGAWSWLNVYPDLGLAVAVNTNMRGREIRDLLRLEPGIVQPFVSV